MKLVTDCAADLPKEEMAELDIIVAPLYINFSGEMVSSNDIEPDDFYHRLKAMVPHVPTTSMPSAGAFAAIYKKLTALGEEILSIHISSGLSGTINAARLGAEQAPEAIVTFVDSQTLSGGERFQVLAALKAVKAGWNKQAILDRLDRVRKSTEVIYTLETLSYLARGGRIGRVQALAGSLLNLKPLINVNKVDGKYSTVGKERTITKAVSSVADHLYKMYGSQTQLWATVLHGQFEEKAQELAKQLKERLNIGKLEILRISPVLGVHTGPGVVGAAVVPMELIEGIK